jgi:hypothetical protein
MEYYLSEIINFFTNPMLYVVCGKIAAVYIIQLLV